MNVVLQNMLQNAFARGVQKGRALERQDVTAAARHDAAHFDDNYAPHDAEALRAFADKVERGEHEPVVDGKVAR